MKKIIPLAMMTALTMMSIIPSAHADMSDDTIEDVTQLLFNQNCFPSALSRDDFIQSSLNKMYNQMSDGATAQQEGSWQDYSNDYTTVVNEVPTCPDVFNAQLQPYVTQKNALMNDISNNEAQLSYIAKETNPSSSDMTRKAQYETNLAQDNAQLNNVNNSINSIISSAASQGFTQ